MDVGYSAPFEKIDHLTHLMLKTVEKENAEVGDAIMAFSLGMGRLLGLSLSLTADEEADFVQNNIEWAATYLNTAKGAPN